MKRVVVVLPYVDNKVLFQLRDIDKKIIYKGKWGYFGGSIDKNEAPLDTAFREIEEETGLKPKFLCYHGIDHPIASVTSYLYSFPLKNSLSDINLTEGVDFGLISMNDIAKGEAFSKKLQKNYPIIRLHFIKRTMERALGIRNEIIRVK